MKVCLVGDGGQGDAYMGSFKKLPQVDVVSAVGLFDEQVKAFADRHGISKHFTSVAEAVSDDEVEAVIICSPTGLHREHAELVLNQGKHCLLEIPMAENIEDCEAIAAAAKESGAVCMVAHTRRFQATFIEVRRRIAAGELTPYHVVFNTYFFRRVNLNREGQPRTWVDNLLWHHACHSVDAMKWLFNDPDMRVWGQKGRIHPELGCVMDMTIGMHSTKADAIVSGSLSFNNHGPIDVCTRFISDEASLKVVSNRGVLEDAEGNEIVKEAFPDGFARQTKEFIDAVEEGREPEASVADCLESMRLLQKIEEQLI